MKFRVLIFDTLDKEGGNDSQANYYLDFSSTVRSVYCTKFRGRVCKISILENAGITVSDSVRRVLCRSHTRFDRWTGDEERRIVAGEHWEITSDQLYPVVEPSMPTGS